MMGSILGRAMNENMKAQQDFMIATQRMQLERQLMMQNALREQQMAVQIARGRDLFHWWASFYTIASVGCFAGFIKRKSGVALVPLVPLTFIIGYLYDMAYGSKMARIRGEAENILLTESYLIDLPQSLPTVDDLDKRRDQYWK